MGCFEPYADHNPILVYHRDIQITVCWAIFLWPQWFPLQFGKPFPYWRMMYERRSFVYSMHLVGRSEIRIWTFLSSRSSLARKFQAIQNTLSIGNQTTEVNRKLPSCQNAPVPSILGLWYGRRRPEYQSNMKYAIPVICGLILFITHW